jgi:N-terminal half of MaoC dehydratase
MIDRKWIGHKMPASVLPIERSRLQFFAKAIGETRAEYLEVEAARAAGYADLPSPPTFLMAADLDSGALDGLVHDLGIPLAQLLHGEQSFTYHKAVCAGDTVTVRSVISDIYDKKGGALEFVIKDSRATNQHEELVVEFRSVLICRRL